MTFALRISTAAVSVLCRWQGGKGILCMFSIAGLIFKEIKEGTYLFMSMVLFIRFCNRSPVSMEREILQSEIADSG